MKKPLRAAVLAALCMSVFSGCASVNALQPELPRSAFTEPTPAATPAATGPSRTDTRYLSKEEAKNIALSDAGLSEKEVTRLRVKFDFDDGVAEYEVNFRHGGYEYDYDLHAETGRIRSREKDLED